MKTRLKPKERTLDADVLVIGAGLAGLAAAQRLRENNIQVKILEARERLGGRTWYEHVTLESGQTIGLNYGGQWVSSSQSNMMALSKRYSIPLYRTPEDGEAIYIAGKKRVAELEALPGVRPAFEALDELAKTVDVANPWQHPQAAELDSQTLQQWLETHVELVAAQQFVGFTVAGTSMACSAEEVSLLDALHDIQSGGGIKALMGCQDGAQEFCLEGGPQAIAKAIADEIGRNTLEFGTVVRHIQQHEAGMTILTNRGSFTAPRAITTIPPVVAKDIAYAPKLPAAKSQALAAMEPGYAIKVQAFYDTQWWIEKGLSGISLDATNGTETFNISHGEVPGNLVTFVYSAQARKLHALPQAGQHQWVIKHLADLFGREALSTIGVFSHSWKNDPFTLGCFSGHFGPGGWATHGPHLREPVGHLFFAGTEIIYDGIARGYMEGAVRSGYAAAQQVMETL